MSNAAADRPKICYNKFMLNEIKKHFTLDNIVLLVAMLLALSWAWSTVNALSKNYDLEKQVQQGKLDNQLIELRNENLRLQQAYYKTDEFLELQARTLLNKANEGEHLVVIPRTIQEQSSAEQSVAKPVIKSNFEQWMDFLFGRRS